MFGKKSLEVFETSDQFKSRLEKENEQSLKITAIDAALKIPKGPNGGDAVSLVADAQKIYDFISK